MKALTSTLFCGIFRGILIIISCCFMLCSNAQVFYPATFHGSTGNDMGADVYVDAAGNSYVVGFFSTSISFGSITISSAGNQDMFIVKYEPNGNVEWAYSIGGTANDNTEWSAVRVHGAENGAIYITGAVDRNADVTFNGTSGSQVIAAAPLNGKDIFLACYLPDGIVSWVHTIGSASGANPETGMDVLVIGNYVFMTGQYWSPCTLSVSPSIVLNHSGTMSDIFIACYSLGGMAEWANYASGASLDVGVKLTEGESGYLYVSGFCGFNNNRTNFPLRGLTSAHNGLWASFVARVDVNYGIWHWVRDHSGSSSLNALVYFDKNTNTLYNSGSCYAGSHVFRDRLAAKNYTCSDEDVYLIAYNTSGDFVWPQGYRIYGGEADQRLYDILLANGRICLFGTFMNSADFGPFHANSAGEEDLFFAEIDPSNGVVTALVRDGGANRDISSAIYQGSNNLLATGLIMETSTIGGNSHAGSALEVFITRIGHTLSAGQEFEVRSVVYPNPSTGSLHMKGEFTSFSISDMNGRELLHGKLEMNDSINVSELIPGTYVIRVTDIRGIITPVKFVRL